ncbi:MAG: hypothetical protein MI807_02050 [Verrucomicrobiales bacterium]|nr:hypothetical protein [Verrucomicrobiales bacterium]
MGHKWTWRELQEKQDQRIHASFGDSATDSWPSIRKLISEADDITPGTKTIWEGPGRAGTLPISYQAGTEFIRRYEDDAKAILAEAAGEDDAVVAGHALMGLDWCDSPLLADAAARCGNRTETVHSIYGSFGWEGTLAEYAERLTNESSEQDGGGQAATRSEST